MIKPYLLYLKIGAVVAVVVAIVGSGVWFRGVLAENRELQDRTARQQQSISELQTELEGMAERANADRRLAEERERQRLASAAALGRAKKALKEARERLDAQTRECFDVVLPDDFLERLPKAH